MEPANGTALNKTTTIAATSASITTSNSALASASNTLLLLASGNNNNNSGSNLTSNAGMKQQQQQPQSQQQQQQHFAQIDAKQEEPNNLSQASSISESQRSISGAPSASSSPILSPSGKIFGRNANGTIIATSRPSNEAEVQLYRVLQRASLLTYYDTLLEMGGDDVQQLYEAGEEEFLEIMALVGMASKPLHVRRLQKALHEWANNPALFQGPFISNVSGLCETPTKATTSIFIPETLGSSRTKFPVISHSFNPTPLMNTMQIISTHSLPQLTVPSVSNMPMTPTSLPFSSVLGPSASVTQAAPHHPTGIAHQVTSSSPQLTPILTETQVGRITLGAEKIALQLPQREPRTQTSKKRTTRELEQVMAMSDNDPRRMDEIRKYSAIYGRFDCKRRPEKPLTLHEVCVNEAAAQLCRLVPALLTRRDELFPLARQIVKDAGFGHSASVARYTSMLSNMQMNQVQRSNASVGDCEPTETSPLTPKRPRFSSSDTASPQDGNRESLDDSRFNLFAMYQKFAKPPFELLDIAKLPLGKSERDDNDDSRFSYGNSSSSSVAHENSDQEREFVDSGIEHVTETVMKLSPPGQTSHYPQSNMQSRSIDQQISGIPPGRCIGGDALSTAPSSLGEVQIISAAGSHIIAVANPALALSPSLNDNALTTSMKREIGSSDI